MRHLSKNVLMKWIIVLLIVMPLLSTIPSTYTANASEPNSNQSVKVKKVIASYQQSYALDTKGHLWAWGYYDFFAFGGLKTPNRLTFFDNKVIKDIQGGPGFLQVLLDDGTVWVHYMYSPTNAKQFFGQVVGLNQIESIGEAVSIGYAKQKDGTVWKYAPTDLSQTPVKMPELSGAGFVTFYDEYGIKSDGTVWSLADSPTKPPTQITELANVKKIVPGDQSRPSYALTVNGEIWGWGKPVLYGYTNVVTTLRLLPDHALQTPVRMEGIEQVKDIAAGQAQFTALKADGTVWSWGLNKNSQLGDGTTTDSASPVKVKNLANVQSLYGGMQAQHAFAVLADGSLMAWGGNSQKETGTELTTKTVASPTKVKFPLQGDKAEDRFTFTFDGAKGNNLSAAVSDGKGKVIVQGENQFYQSTDYGQSWATKPFPLNLVDPQIRFEHNLYFLEGYSDLAKHLYTSKNGQDWTEIVLKEHRTLTIMDKLRITWQNNQYILSLYLNDEKKTAL